MNKILSPVFYRESEVIDDAAMRINAPSIFAQRPHPSVSSRYTFVPTIDVINKLRGHGWQPVAAFQQRVRKDGKAGFQMHMVCLRHQDVVAKAGDYAIELILQNSHDRSSLYDLGGGLLRFTCGNGMVVSEGTVESVKIRHSDNTADAVIEASFAVAGRMDKIRERVDLFKSKTISSPTDYDFAERALALRFDGDSIAPIQPDRLLIARRNDDIGTSLWHLLNRVQENLLRGGMRDHRVHRMTKTRAVTGLQRSLNINRGLWELAEEFSKN